jgi:uncharacterized protein YceK
MANDFGDNYGTGMQSVQSDITTGNVYDIYTDLDQDVKYDRIPFLGAKVKYRDGRCFCFVSTLVAHTAGALVSSIVAPAEFAGKFKARAAGFDTIALTAAGVTLDQYSGGTLVITESSGQKTSYYIVGNTITLTVAEGIGAIGDVILTLGNLLVGAVAAADDCVLYASKYANTIVGTSASVAVGVAVIDSDVTAVTDATTGYMWVQTHGVGGVLVGTEAGSVAGVAAMAGTAVAEISDGTNQYLGVFLPASAVSDTDLCPIDLCIG